MDSFINTYKNLRRIPFWFSLLAVCIAIFDFGFDQSSDLETIIRWVYSITLILGIISLFLSYLSSKYRPRIKVWFIDALLLTIITTVLANNLRLLEITTLGSDFVLFFSMLLVFIREFSLLNINFSKEYINPAQLFVISFLFIILLGSLLLKLPNATYHGISYVDALFTSTSAVCVTGLIVVDTGSYFTLFGQTIILFLIQLGGLGIMTFTSYFSYFFKGGSSYENQLILKDMTNSDKIADVFNTLKKIILLTFLVEGTGAVLIFTSLEQSLFQSSWDQIFFSIFHTVSGFCNAGFSTLPNSLYQEGFRFNYPLHLTIAFLFIIGGIGFPIIFNFFKYLKYLIVNHLLRFTRNKQPIHVPWIVNLNARVVLITTAILITVGTITFYLFEYNNTLAGHSSFGKIVTAFFGAVTPRTAGFNTVDTSELHFATVMVIFLLMWIGASPGSTGGGIKTSTFAIGTLNFFSLARGKDRMELFKREVSELSVRRAFAIISLSLVVIGFAVFCISIFDPNKKLLPIAFECFSAYSTVGLSLGITSQFSNPSKLVLIITMFVGRVSMLTILIALLRKVKHLKYRYPTEEILIN